MTCCSTTDILTHYVGEAKKYYADLGEAIKGRTITAVVSVTASDAALTISGAAVLGVNTADYDQCGRAITIEANTGVEWTMAGGTTGDAVDEFTAILTISFTTSAGTEQAKIRVKVM